MGINEDLKPFLADCGVVTAPDAPVPHAIYKRTHATVGNYASERDAWVRQVEEISAIISQFVFPPAKPQGATTVTAGNADMPADPAMIARAVPVTNKKAGLTFQGVNMDQYAYGGGKKHYAHFYLQPVMATRLLALFDAAAKEKGWNLRIYSAARQNGVTQGKNGSYTSNHERGLACDFTVLNGPKNDAKSADFGYPYNTQVAKWVAANCNRFGLYQNAYIKASDPYHVTSVPSGG